MQINKELSEEIYNEAGTPRLSKAKAYVQQGKVKIRKADYENANNFSLAAEVNGNFDTYEVNIDVKNGELNVASCECQDYQKNYSACKHIVATLLKFEQTKFWDEEPSARKISKNNEIKYRGFKNLVNTFYNEQIEEINLVNAISQITSDKKVKIEVNAEYNRFLTGIKLQFKIGNKRMYKIKDLEEFYTRMKNKDYYKYGEKLTLVHNSEFFDEEYRPLLDFILRYAEILKNSTTERYNYYYTSSLNQSSIILGENTIDEAFDILKNIKVNFITDFDTERLNFIENNPNIEFELTKINEEDLSLKPNVDIFKIAVFKGRKYIYLLDENYLYRCTNEFADSTLKLVKAFRENYTSEIVLKKEDLKDLYSVIIPKINAKVKLVDITEEEVEKYKPQKLAVKVFLDYDESSFLTADVKFCYQDEEFNPLEENVQIKARRNLLEENMNLNIFKKTGFMIDVNNLRFILPDDEKIYNFLIDDINYYMQKFEVLVTENFKTKEIKEPKVGTIGVKVENNLLNIDMSKINISADEIQFVMEKYKLKKKFFRLKDGSFLNLNQNEDMEFIEKLTTGMDIDYKDIENNKIKLPVNRTLYLNELLKKFKNTTTVRNNEYKEIISNLEKDNLEEEINIPKNLNANLREYQKIGFKWLKTLDYYRFGGILADDMGLGKTLQLLAIVMSYIENESENRKTSIVVSPSSLSLNWLNESKKFTPNLKVKVVTGKAQERKEIIQNLDKYDLLITSYDLLKRDIEKYKDLNYNFKYIIADEAQYLKNTNTQNAKAIKSLKAETRYALTGTPIENSLSELWSIFDFIMPGYLFTYKKFRNMYETPIVKEKDEYQMSKLKMLIEPFILRRTKKGVLTELPEKTITVLNNNMEEEQEKIYMSYLTKAKKEVAEQININGFEKSQIMVLAALTRLRQICCHPGLFIENYNGESSKLNQCMEIVEDAVSAGHKILLFSGYTSMFDIIQRELNLRNIKYFKLTGSTKVNERIELVEEFNKNPDIKIFLISLKAGGTGLNLTGADMVIHYDPWWNVSSENQATDRAYRIGQKNNVQVYKLITSNSIEEKIYELQQKKSELVDNMLATKTSFISKFSKEEIMGLFN